MNERLSVNSRAKTTTKRAEDSALAFPSTPIDGRMRHAHRDYFPLSHGCSCPSMYHLKGCEPHPHDGAGHLIDIGADCGFHYGPSPKTDGQSSVEEKR